MRRVVLAATWAAGVVAMAAPQEIGVRRTVVFRGGEDGYPTVRIPAIVATTRGTLLAFCEGRRHGPRDWGDIDLLVKRSTDGGATWSPARIVWNEGTNTCGNPCAVVDRASGRVRLWMTWNHGGDAEPRIIAGTSLDTRRVFLTHSDDDGLIWAPAVEMTDRVRATNWTWYATGPGAGIQLEHGPHGGRWSSP